MNIKEFKEYCNAHGYSDKEASVFRDGYETGYLDGSEEAENRFNRVLDDEKRISYQQGRADAIDEFKQALKQELNKYDFWIYDIADSDGYTLETSCNRDFLIDEVADQMKGE